MSMESNVNQSNNEVLVNLTKSSCRDLEFEVAEMRCTYPEKIERLLNSIIDENIQALKNFYLNSSIAPVVEENVLNDREKIQNLADELSFHVFKSIPSEIQVSHCNIGAVSEKKIMT